MMAKKRLDQLLVERGLAESRTRAQALIMAGKVLVGDKPVDKAGQQVAEDAAIVRQGPRPSLGVARRHQARSCASTISAST